MGYEPFNWQYGDMPSSERLNHIENGIKELEENSNSYTITAEDKEEIAANIIADGVKATTADGSLLPAVTSEDNGKILRVVNSMWTAVELVSAGGVSF